MLCEPEVVDQLEKTKFANFWKDTLGLNDNMPLSGDHVIKLVVTGSVISHCFKVSFSYGLLCSMSQVDRNRDHNVVPKFWWHRACIDAKKGLQDVICKFAPELKYPKLCFCVWTSNATSLLGTKFATLAIAVESKCN